MILGIDPDTYNTGLALADRSQVYAVGVAQASGSDIPKRLQMLGKAVKEQLNGFSIATNPRLVMVVVERVEIRQKGRARPEDLMLLALATGVIVEAVRGSFAFGCGLPILLPYAKAWKGSVPKRIHQARIYSKLGWDYEVTGTEERGYAYPTSPPVGPKRNKTAWKHIGDAIGLAMWGDEEWRKRVDRDLRRGG